MSYEQTRFLYTPANFYYGWDDCNEETEAADKIIASPDRFLLTQNQLFQAQGGINGFLLQSAFALGGVGLVFGSSPRMATYWRNGCMKWMEWLCVGGTFTSFWFLGGAASTSYLGDPIAVRNHRIAYTLVKENNRWEGRQILKKPPMRY